MKELIEIKRVLFKYGTKHKVTIRENEVVVWNIKEIHENIVISNYGKIELEMNNGVKIWISLENLVKYLKESSKSRVKEMIRSVIESRHPNQEITEEEVEQYYNDDAYLTKYISQDYNETGFEYKL